MYSLLLNAITLEHRSSNSLSVSLIQWFNKFTSLLKRNRNYKHQTSGNTFIYSFSDGFTECKERRKIQWHSLTLLGKIYIHKTSFSVFPSKTPPAISFFWPFEFPFWWNLRRPKQFSSIFNMHPDDRLFPLIASVLQTSVAVGGPNTCNLAAGQILAQHTLAMNYLEMASVPQIHLCFVLVFFSLSATRTKTQFPFPYT